MPSTAAASQFCGVGVVDGSVEAGRKRQRVDALGAYHSHANSAIDLHIRVSGNICICFGLSIDFNKEIRYKIVLEL